MDGLDFSLLTDDQLLGLIRAALREAVARSPGMAAAAEAATLDEAERARVARDATDVEVARLRVVERQRVAAAAAAQVRAAQEAQEREAVRQRGERAAREAAEIIERKAAATRNWLSRAAALVDRRPEEISILLIDTRYGRRVLINPGSDRYEREHFSDWAVETKAIKTTRELVKRKPQLAALSAEFAARHADKTVALIGADQDWSVTA